MTADHRVSAANGIPGAVDLLTKPFEHGGFNLGRISSSLFIAIFIAGFVLISAQREINSRREGGR